MFNNIAEQLQINDIEMIKIREGEGGGCTYFDRVAGGCRIYARRPLECAALKCWDRSEFDRVFRGAKLERKDLVEDPVLQGLIREHEKRCGYGELDRLVREIESGGKRVVEDILTRLRFDFQLRPFVSEKLNLDPHHMDLYFGRPLIRTIEMFGLEVRPETDGSFLLTAKKEGQRIKEKEQRKDKGE